MEAEHRLSTHATMAGDEAVALSVRLSKAEAKAAVLRACIE
jgi:hypothetical protein